ncbi:MAG: HNH endonuclease [Acidobacteria bacterium]|nr:MAG: HNH endonuclease [Acidobacteriota bacterium]
MPQRPCLVCGRLTRNGSWCEAHVPVWKQRSPSSRATARPGWSKLRAEALRRDGRRCVHCGAGDDGLEIHHVVPVSEGGANVLSNVVTICHACHRGAHRVPPARA